MVDDSESSTDEDDWDTEDASDDGEGATDDGQPQEGEGQLAEAAAEAQRHRDMFAKVDRRSYTQLNRSQSGLLSQIFHPSPERFPLDHPYRYSRSTQDILAHVTQGPARQFYMPGAMTAMQAQPKSSVAMPTQVNVVAQCVGSPTHTRKSPLRRPPQDAEMESDSGDDTENKLDMSKSLAQKKLQEHMTRSSSKQRQQQQQPQQSTGLFGSLAQPSTNLGGSTLFGSTQPGNSFLGLSNAGASTSNLFAPKTSLIQTQPQGDSAQAQFIGLVQKIEATAQAWDASSPQCRFQVSLITTCSTEWHF